MRWAMMTDGPTTIPHALGSQMRVVQPFAHVHVSFDVLKRDRGIIDQNPDCKRQATERHNIDRFTKQMQYN